jgi:hypothetical protein
MATPNIRSRRGSNAGRRSSIFDSNENKPIKQQTPVKVLVFNGKCSEIFKSTLEECVEDCILQFPGQNPIYIPKAGQAAPRPIASRQSSNSNVYPSARSNRRRSSVAPIAGLRSSQTNNLSMPTVALTAASASRMRQQFAHQRLAFVEDITEEETDYQTIAPDPTIAEPEFEQHQQHTAHEESANSDATSQTTYSTAHRKYPSARVYTSYRNHQKEFRLSDLVMRGPEYYAHIFNLPRTSRYPTRSTSTQCSNSDQHSQKTEEKYNELDLIKQDLFHRYLWTQKPQVSCRIRPISTYKRSTTFVL